MNILFFTYGQVSPTVGGTERTTVSVATGLTKYFGHCCFSIYEVPRGMPTAGCFVQEWMLPTNPDGKIDSEAFRNIIVSKNIDTIIIQGSFIHVRIFREMLSDIACRIILAHHFEPGWEDVFYTFKDQWGNMWHKHTSLRNMVKSAASVAFYPYYRWRYHRNLRRNYRDAYKYADKVVLLSEKFIPRYMQFCGMTGTDCDNFAVIPNMLSLSDSINEEEFGMKRNVALIVARLEESCKNISAALEIWRRVKNDSRSKGWCLKIVGDGQDRKRYERQIISDNIKDVELLGRRDPVPYYREASVFLMTSKSESWGLTLTEAQQMGCVPIAFDSYATLREIISNGENGILVEDGNVSEYAESMLMLMEDAELRHMFAANGEISCRRFKDISIVPQWNKLLTSLCKSGSCK